MKQPFTYSVLRYVHDAVTGEFVNVGVVVCCPNLDFLEARFEHRYGRASSLFAKEVDGRQYRKMLKATEVRVRSFTKEWKQGSLLERRPTDAIEIARKILPLDDSALQFHRGSAGVTADPSQTLAYLYERYVGRYIVGADKASRTDGQVLSLLRSSLEAADLRDKVRPLEFESDTFSHTFPISWQNGRMKACEPLSFDLLEADAIRQKAHRWVGQARSIQEQDPQLRLIFFLGKPAHTQQRESFQEGREILERFVDLDHSVLDEGQTEQLIRELQEDLS